MTGSILGEVLYWQVAKTQLPLRLFTRENEGLSLRPLAYPDHIRCDFSVSDQWADQLSRNSEGQQINRMIRNSSLNVVAYREVVQQREIVDMHETLVHID